MRARLTLAALLVAGCQVASTDEPSTSVDGEPITCDLGSPNGLGNACVKAGSPVAITQGATVVANTNGYGVHMIAGVSGYFANLFFQPTQTATYEIYLGTPNIPFSVREIGAGDVSPTCTSSITSTECTYLRKVRSYNLVAHHRYEIRIGSTTLVHYVRLHVQTKLVAPASCKAGELTEEAAACTAADTGSRAVTAAQLGASSAPLLALNTVYGVSLPSAGGGTFAGAFRFAPASDGEYELYRGTPNIPLRVIDETSPAVAITCTHYIPSTECSLLRRGDRLPLHRGHTYRFELGPNAGTRWVRVTLRKEPGGVVKLGPLHGYPAGNASSYLTPADLDGDGELDLVDSSPDDASGQTFVEPLRGTGTGAFSVVEDILTSAPADTVVSDFNRDLIPDIVGIAWDGQGPLPDFYLRGEGAFSYATSTWGDFRDFRPRLSAGDFDEDGTLDLVAAWADSQGGTGTGGFVITHMPDFTVAQDEPAFAAQTLQAVAGDFNGDGHQDVVAASSTSSAIQLYTGSGSGTVAFATQVALPGDRITEIAAVDLDRDGRSDLVAIHANGTVTISRGLAMGFAAPGVFVVSGLDPRGIAAGDFDHDGRLDLAISTGRSTTSPAVTIFLASDAGFVAAATLAVPGISVFTKPAVGDFNDDGWDDLAIPAIGAVDVFLSTP